MLAAIRNVLLATVAIVVATPPSIVESATVDGTSTAAFSVVSGAFTAGAGSNRRVLAEVVWKAGGSSVVNQITSCVVTGGVAFTKIAETGAEGTPGTGSIRDGIAYFELAEGSIPAGSFTVTATANGTTAPTNMLIRVFTVKDAKNAATTVSAKTLNLSTAPGLLADVPVTKANSLVILGYETSSTVSLAVSAGFTKIGTALVNGGTAQLAYQANTPAGTLSQVGCTGTTAGVHCAEVFLVYAP